MRDQGFEQFFNEDRETLEYGQPGAVGPSNATGEKDHRHLTPLTLLRDLAFSLLLALLVVVFIYQPVKVEGTSMMPSIVDQERIFINKFLYRLGLTPIHRGDVVVFWYPGDPTRSYIKRVIGLPGERLEIRRGIVYINGKQLDEPYVPDEYRSREDLGPIKIPMDYYFLMGDHRKSSNDSRIWGPIHKKYIYGKAVFAYWPLDRIRTIP